MEIADKIFDSSLIVFSVSAVIFWFTSIEDLRKLNRIAQSFLCASFWVPALLMILSKIAMVWLK